MLPSRHIMVSLPLGVVVWFLTQSAFAGLLSFISGVLVDVDHIIDYMIYYGLSSDFRKMYQRCGKWAKREEEIKLKNIYLIFHTIEMAVLLWITFVFTKNIYVLAIALGYTGHLILDIVSRRLKPYAFFITWRMKNNFAAIRLLS